MSDRAHGSIESGGSLADVRLGDTIVVLTVTESIREVVVTAAGPVWVTALGTRFRRENGRAAGDGSRPCAMTVAENDRREETRRVLGVLRAWGLTRSVTAVHELSLDQLARVARLLESFEALAAEADTRFERWFKGMDLGPALRWTREPFMAGWQARGDEQSFNESAAAYAASGRGLDLTWAAEAFEAGWLARARSS